MDGEEADCFGNATLLARVLELRPRVHLFGHAHRDFGMQAGLSTAFSNGSIASSRSKTIRTGNKITF
jgi:Icc-related predicted phosphoesterase